MAESDIFVRFGADIGPLKEGAKKAGQSISEVGAKARQSANDIGKWGAAAAAAAATASVALTKSVAESAREIKNLSAVAGISTTEFQKMAAGAKTVGIEQEKLADIFKDVDDKVGDFMQTGAGPLADFFENIAPKVGLAKDAFAGLSGSESLQKYTDALEQANVSQSEMTFYLEAISSDAKMLQPLLENGGEGFRKMGVEAENLGAVLSGADIAQLENLNKAIDQGELALSGMANTIAVDLSPYLVEIGEKISDFTSDTQKMDDIVSSSVEGIAQAVGVMANAWRGVEVGAQGAEVAFDAVKAAGLAVFSSLVDGVDIARVTILSNINGIISELNAIPGVDIAQIALGGESSLAASIRAQAAEANAALTQSRDELHNIMMAPLPSEEIETFLESVRMKNEAERLEYVTHKQNLASIDEQGKAEALSREQTFANAMNSISSTWTHAETDAVAGMFGNLSTLMQTENKRMFDIGKKAAQAQTVVSTYSAAQKAYESLAGIPVVGPGLGAAAAAAAVVAGGVRLQAINSTSFGGSSSVSAGGAAAAPAASAAPAAAPEPERTVRLESLDPSSLFTGQTVTNLAEQLVELQNDGFKLVV